MVFFISFLKLFFYLKLFFILKKILILCFHVFSSNKKNIKFFLNYLILYFKLLSRLDRNKIRLKQDKIETRLDGKEIRGRLD